MKTSNKIALFGGAAIILTMLLTFTICHTKTLATQEELRPLARELNRTTIHVVKELPSNIERKVDRGGEVTDRRVFVNRSRQTSSIKVIRDTPSVSDFALVGDTLFFSGPYSIELNLPEVTQLITCEGEVIELKII